MKDRMDAQHPIECVYICFGWTFCTLATFRHVVLLLGQGFFLFISADLVSDGRGKAGFSRFV
jgi:hypothetical protein